MDGACAWVHALLISDRSHCRNAGFDPGGQFSFTVTCFISALALLLMPKGAPLTRPHGLTLGPSGSLLTWLGRWCCPGLWEAGAHVPSLVPYEPRAARVTSGLAWRPSQVGLDISIMQPPGRPTVGLVSSKAVWQSLFCTSLTLAHLPC